MSAVIWVSGASSGIGAAFVAAAGERRPGARTIGISRRPGEGAEHLAADLSDPDSWTAVEAHFEEVLDGGEYDEAVFFHCAGTVEGNGPMADADPEAYRRAVLLNAGSGPVLGRAFLVATGNRGVAATMVMCSSPGAHLPVPEMTHYSAGKAAVAHWARAAAAEVGEDGPRVFSVVPYEVDTAMVRGVMEQELPLSRFFREAAAGDGLVSAEKAATDIWDGIERGVPQGGSLPIGANPPEGLEPPR